MKILSFLAALTLTVTVVPQVCAAAPAPADSIMAAGPVADSAAASVTPVLMPAPRSATLGPAAFALPGSLSVRWDGIRLPVLTQAVERFRDRLSLLSGQAMRFQTGEGAPLTLTIRCLDRDPGFRGLAMKEDYTLDVASQGIVLTASGPAGVLHGLTTLLQLVGRDATRAVMTPAHIVDSPRFAWRGLMLDVSRHFMSVATLERQMDAMELTRLNVLHLHLSDGEAFRVESRLYPRLHRMGGQGGYYTQKDIRALVAYAARRGIRVVPEFDTPGHAFSIVEAYPQYASVTPLDRSVRALLNRAALDPTQPGTYRMVSRLYREMAGLFPDRYFHIGGDEVTASQWTGTPRIAAYMAAHHYDTPREMQAGFTRRVVGDVSRMGKIAIGWDEVAQADIPAGTIVQVWRGQAHTASATAAGHQVIVSNGYYLDHLLPASAYYATDPLDTAASSANAEGAAKTTAPGGTIAGTAASTLTPALSDEQKSLVLGAEASLWTEIVSEEMLDGRLWPRMTALAERFWSQPAACDSASLYPRLGVMQDRLEVLGVQAGPNSHRMLQRLAPGDTVAASVLLDVTSPVRNYGHNHEFIQIRHKQTAQLQDLNHLADIASPDSFAAERFNRDALAYARGDKTLKPVLVRQLTLWADNVEAFARSAEIHPALRDSVPASERLGALAQAGLASLKVHRTSGWKKRARRLLAQTQEDYAASSNTSVVTNATQPGGDLLQRILPGVQVLFAHATGADG